MTKIPLSPSLLSDCSPPPPSFPLLPLTPFSSSFSLLFPPPWWLPLPLSIPLQQPLLPPPLPPHALLHLLQSPPTSPPLSWQLPPPLPLLTDNPSFPLPFLLIPFSSSSSSSKPTHEPSHSTVAPPTSTPSSLATPPSPSSPSSSLLSPPPIPSFSSSNPTYKVFNATLTLHTNLRDPTLPLHGGSLHLRPFLTGDPSFLLLPFLLTPFSSLSFSSKPTHEPFPSTMAPSTSTLSLLATSPPLLPHLFSSSFNPTYEAFNATLHANLRDLTLPLHDGSLHLHPFLAGDL